MVWACYSILMKKIGAFRMNMVFCTRKVFFYGLLFMLPALFIFDCRLGLERFASPVNTLNLLYLGFGASALCFVTWNWAVRILGAVKTTVYIYLVPVVTVVSSVIILHETITPLAIAGTALTLTADRFTTIRELLGEGGSRRKRPLLHLTLFLFRQFSSSHHKAAFPYRKKRLYDVPKGETHFITTNLLELLIHIVQAGKNKPLSAVPPSPALDNNSISN
mgnify:CR=1 FL=1